MDKKETFITAIKENESLLYKVASVYTRNADDRNDLIQEIVYQLWRSYDSFNGRSALSTWIYRVALNVSINQLKIEKRRISTVPIEEQFMDGYEAGKQDDETRWEEFRQQIDTLNLLDKALVMLYLDNKSYAEIAEIIGISASNVGTKLSRIKEKLRKQVIKST